MHKHRIFLLALVVTVSVALVFFQSKYFKTEEKTVSEDKLLLLVASDVLPYINAELKDYSNDVKKELNLSTDVQAVQTNTDILSLRKFVIDYSEKNKLKGILLVGDVPTANMYHPDVTNSEFLNEGMVLADNIYQDTLYACEYSESLKAFSYKNPDCQTATTIQPYWVSRITPNSSKKSSTQLIKDYFRRNHEFRNAGTDFNRKVLAYTPIILDEKGREKEIENGLKKDITSFKTYSDADYKFIDVFDLNSDNEYLKQLNNKWEVVFYNGHGAPNFHQKKVNKETQIEANFFFGDFLSCSIGRFTSQDYLLGEYLFSGGLVATGVSTPSYGSTNFDNGFYNLLSKNVPVSEALVWRGVGGNLFGDPTLKMRYSKTPSNTKKLEVSDSQLVLTKDNPIKEITIFNNSKDIIYFDIRAKFYKQKDVHIMDGFNLLFDNHASSIDGTQLYSLKPKDKTTLRIESDLFIPYEKIIGKDYFGQILINSDSDTEPLIKINVIFRG